MNRAYFVSGQPKLSATHFAEKYAYQKAGHMLGRRTTQ